MKLNKLGYKKAIMAILTTNLIIKKPQGIHHKCEEGLIDIQPIKKRKPGNRSIAALLCLSMLALLVAAAGLGSGLLVYQQYLRGNGFHHYKGFCTIPITNRALDPILASSNQQRQPLYIPAESDDELFSLYDDDDDDSNSVLSFLRERLEIANNVTKVVVFDNGRRVTFTHDFNANITGIADEERCFVMGLDREVVANPTVFVVGIQSDDVFDVSHVRTSLVADLPAISDLAGLVQEAGLILENCENRPLYRLSKAGNGSIIRKRSANNRPQDYIQFSGRHVQEIEIANLPQLLREERVARNGRSSA